MRRDGQASRRDLLAGAAAATFLGGVAAAEDAPVNHVVLLGDSVFDNGAYVGGGPDVVAQLRQRLPRGWQASLAARDGGRMEDMPQQLRAMPAGASHLVISVGGNDALAHAGIFEEAAGSVGDALLQVAAVRQDFEAAYRAMLDQAQALGLPVAVCTIYDTAYREPRRTLAVTALAVLNDAITRQAFRRGLPLVDLRLVCDEAADFANPIEPSVQGGGKIARAITTMLAGHDFGRGRAAVYL
ncbi:SGNH/GDSL hydrolase family protein [Geminicoccus roseus]|uniref:SGNH/GDSL hydrolase family protein n=1 Tax=Geminicoccus roseus TaxID=404900 RepID=UPI0009FFB14F|nr:SGNH/GDSL hydrolase family protein [Geminicoccus roseus]